MRRPRDVDDETTRRATLGLVGGLVAAAVGLAPSAHRRAVLEELDVDVLAYRFVDGAAWWHVDDETGTFTATETGEVSLASLPDDVDDVDEDGREYGTIEAIRVELANGTDEPLDPLVSTWDQRRKTRHNWRIDEGPVPLPAGETAEYVVVAPGRTARLHAGVPAQITVYRRGEQRWKSVQVETPDR